MITEKDFDSFLWAKREFQETLARLQSEGHSEEDADLFMMVVPAAMRMAMSDNPSKALRRFTEMLEKSLPIWIEKLKRTESE